MSKNDGCVYLDFFEESLEEKIKIATNFSEGNPKLQNALLNMWNINIKTIACCNGHNSPDENELWYLLFFIDENSRNLVNKLIEYLYTVNKEGIQYDLSINHNKLAMNITSVNINDRDDILEFISNVVETREDTLNDKDILTCAMYITDFVIFNGIDFRLTFDNTEMILSFLKKGAIPFFTDDMPQLNECIESIKTSGKLPLRSFICDVKSLEIFLHTVYTDAQEFKVEHKIKS